MTKNARELESMLIAMGRRIRARRESIGSTQLQAARAAEMSVRRWQGIEYGSVNPTVSILLRVADALHVELRDLIPAVAEVADVPKEAEPGEALRKALCANDEVRFFVVSLTALGLAVTAGQLMPTDPVSALVHDGALSVPACLNWVLRRLHEGDSPLHLGQIQKDYDTYVRGLLPDRGVGLGLLSQAALMGAQDGLVAVRPPPPPLTKSPRT